MRLDALTFAVAAALVAEPRPRTSLGVEFGQGLNSLSSRT